MVKKWWIIFAGLLSVAALCLQPLAVKADGSGVIDVFPDTGAFQAIHREDINSLTVIDFSGDYSRSLNGRSNVEPRAVVAREFLRLHPDHYDFIVVFSTFEFDTGEALAFHWGVQNKVKGIGLPGFDNSALFGSQGRLLGYIDMAALSRYVLDPLDPKFEEVLVTLGHEVLHQWSGRIRFDQGSGPETALLGSGGSHWSNLLDSGASLLYGHQWRDEGGGQFRSVARQRFFSPLDLYLAGMYHADEVPPVKLIVNPDQDPQLTPSESMNINGPVIQGVARTITISDIISAEGVRVPATGEARKDFRFAFIVLAKHGEVVSAQQLSGIDQLRRAFVNRFAAWTGGRGRVEVFPEAMPEFEVGVPEVVTGGDPRLTPVNIAQGFAWLRNQQQPEGFWRDKDSTILRDTAVSLDVLARFDADFNRQADGLNWLLAHQSTNTDFLARQALVLTNLKRESDAAILIEQLLAVQNFDGGWGVGREFQSNPLDTAMVLQVLAKQSVAMPAVKSGVNYLLSQQNTDGGWSSRDAGPSRTSVTALVLRLLKFLNHHALVAPPAIAWLTARQNVDGGFGNSPSTSHDTAEIIQTMIELDAIDQIRAQDAATYLLSRQTEEGSWGGSSYATAMSLAALQQFSFPNWSLDPVIVVQPAAPVDGDKVRLQLRVRNDANLAAPASVLRVYEGDPQSGVVIGHDLQIPPLPSGGAVSFTVYWDTFGKVGVHTLVALIDPGHVQQEMSEQDNRAAVVLTVSPAPTGIDLSIVDDDVLMTPTQPDRLPETLAFSINLRNLGMMDATAVRVQLRLGTADGPLLEEVVLDVAGRSTLSANLIYELTADLLTDGPVSFVLVVVTADGVSEVRNDNNEVSINVEPVASLDLAVKASDISRNIIAPLVGEDLHFTVNLHNYGTRDLPAANVKYLISDGSTTTEIQNNNIQIAAGRSAQQTVIWRVDRSGPLSFIVQADPDNFLPEIDENNNQAVMSFGSNQVSGPNLAVSFKDFYFTPDPGIEGAAVTLTALLRNTGTELANHVETAFYNGDPDQGGVLLGMATPLAGLAPGVAQEVSFVWPFIPNATDKILFVVADPNNHIAEFLETDNRAFNVLKVLSLPDLAVSHGDINFSPGFPRAGDTVTISARVANLGRQMANAVVVRAFNGDPGNGGTQIGTDATFDLEGNATALAQFAFTLPDANALASVFISVDPDNVIIEQTELNNLAHRTLAVQDGNFFVSQRYVSPNGDGVQDNTQFFFRLQQPADVAIQVMNWRGQVVRHFDRSDLNTFSHGDVVWDGLDDSGRVVHDGRYRIQVVGLNVGLLGEALVLIDTNRSPLSQALDTRYAVTTNLTCNANDYTNFIAAEDDSGFIYISNGSSHIYRVDSAGSNKRLLMSVDAVRLSNYTHFNSIIANDDLSAIAFSIADPFTEVSRLWLMDGEGGNRREFNPGIVLQYDGSTVRLLGFGADERVIIFLAEDVLYKLHVDTQVLNVLYDFSSDDYFRDDNAVFDFSADQHYLLVNASPNSDRQRFILLDIESGNADTLLDMSTQNSQSVVYAAWSPDGSKILLFDGIDHKVHLYNPQAELLFEQPWPLIPQKDELITVRPPAWSVASDEFAFVMHLKKVIDGGGSSDGPSGNQQNNDGGGFYVFNVQTRTVEKVYPFDYVVEEAPRKAVQLSQDKNTNILPAPFFDFGYGVLNWIPNERGLLFWGQDTDNTGSYLWYFDLDLPLPVMPRAVMRDFDNLVQDIRFTQTGRQWLFNSGKAQNNPNCDNNGLDTWSFRSLLNLTADLRALRSDSAGGVILSGTAADINFNNYQLDYAMDTGQGPGTWRPVQPASGEQVLDARFTLWVPPAPGRYFVRLTVNDLAGNQRQRIQRVVWAEAQSITDLFRTPAAFSPNGDGASDAVSIHYRVLQPVHLEFNFFAADGRLVRRFVRDHTELGASFEISWDGRDQNGVLLPDGEYRMVVQNYEFAFTLDARSPTTSLVLQDAYQPSFDKESKLTVVAVQPELRWSVSDPNYRDSVVQSGFLDQSSSFVDLFDVDPLELGEGLENLKPLSIEQLNRRVFRLVAEDSAGNQSVSIVGPAAEQLIVNKFGLHEFNPVLQELLDANAIDAGQAGMITPSMVREAGGYFSGLHSVPYAPLNSNHGAETVMKVPASKLRFEIAETLRHALLDLRVQYRLLNATDWQEAAVHTFYDAALIPNESTVVNGLEHHLQAVWEPENMDPQAVYILRLRALDITNKEHFSNVFRVQFRGAILFKGLAGAEDLLLLRPFIGNSPVAADEFVLWGTEDREQPGLELRLFVQSDEDPRYRTAQQLGISLGARRRFVFRTKELSSCRRYYGHVIVKAGAEVFSLPPVPFETPCVDLRVKAEPIAALACNLPAPEEVRIKFATSSKDGRGLALLTLSPVADINNVMFNVNQPASVVIPPGPSEPSYNYTYTLDTGSIPEGKHDFVARLINVDDQLVSRIVTVIVDRSPPVLSLNFPNEGDRVCGVPQLLPSGEINNVLLLEGHIQDDNRFHYQVAVDNGSALGQDAELLHDSRSLDSIRAARGEQARVDPAKPDFHLNKVSGPLAALFNRSGEVTVQLSAFDEGGFQQCTQRSFVFDGVVEEIEASVSEQIFSPNGDGVRDEVSIFYNAAEAISLDIEVYAASQDENGHLRTSGNVLASIVNDLALLSGTGETVWNGYANNGSVLMDGLYAVQLSFTDSCGNRRQELVALEIDTTAPQVILDYPASDVPLPMVIEVLGSVNDLHLAHYVVEFGVGAAPSGWVRLAEGDRNQSNEILARWNSFGQNGVHVLRLGAMDTAGNESQIEVPLNFATRVNVINYLEAVESLFSPNGDGRRESSAIRFALDHAALVTLEVLDASNNVRRRLLQDQTLNKGPAVIAWNGRDDANHLLVDGTYRVRLHAVMASNPAIYQEEFISLTLDATPPQINLVRPASGFISAGASVLGSIEDVHLSEYSVSIATNPDAPVWKIVSAGTQNRINTVLGSLAGLAEGNYLLRVNARDRAEIQVEKLLAFQIDNTAPVVTFTAPEMAIHVGGARSEVDIAATVEEQHPAYYRLQSGIGSQPQQWVSLTEGSKFPWPVPLARWDVTHLTDGEYSLRLQVEDKAGLSAQANMKLTVDHTLPIAAISSPLPGAFVTQAVHIEGVAKDVNLLEYRLSVAPVGNGAIQSFSEIGVATQAVENGHLLRWEALPPDGLYTLRLQVKDKAGNSRDVTQEVRVDTTPPAAPQGLNAKLGQEGHVHLKWLANQEPDLAGYAVYRNGIKLTSVTASMLIFVDQGASEGRYSYTVRALDKAGLESTASAAAEIVVDKTPPQTRLITPIADSEVSGLLEIVGTAFSLDDFREYRVYVASADTPDLRQLLRRSPVPVTADVLADWGTLGLPEGAVYVLSLEADDINGNIGKAEVILRIDNQAPAKPVGLQASANSADVQLSWTANTETDLQGYLLFRNGRLANASGTVIGDLQPYAIRDTQYHDNGLVDGTYHYTVAAVDDAGNISEASTAVELEIDTRIPQAVIVQPVDQTRFELPLYVLAVSQDQDINHVQFQYKAATSATWLDAGVPDTVAPYAYDFDAQVSGLSYGEYQLRAIATDKAGQTDANPAVITVHYGDLTQPAVPMHLTALVDGGDVQLNWAANTEADLAGYHVYRVDAQDGVVRLTAALLNTTAFLDTNVEDGVYRYSIVAVDENQNESNTSIEVSAQVYTPQLKPIFSPLQEAFTQLQGSGAVDAEVIVDVTNANGNIRLSNGHSDMEGLFLLPHVALELGSNLFEVRLQDAAGNLSKVAAVFVVRGDVPSQPTGLQGTASAYDVSLNWNANPENNIIGYRVFRNNEILIEDERITATSASASGGYLPATNVIDGSTQTHWETPWPHQGQWLSIEWSAPRLVSRVYLHWRYTQNHPRNFDIEAWFMGQWLSVLQLRNFESNTIDNIFDLPAPYYTSRLRIRSVGDEYYRVAEFSADAVGMVTASAFNTVEPDGRHAYTVTALNAYGFESLPSSPLVLDVGDVVPPDAVSVSAQVSAADVSLNWSASASADVVRYDLYRDGNLLAMLSDISVLNYTDYGLMNGSYSYVVHVVDAADNESLSNEAVAIVNLQPPSAPSDLSIQVQPAGNQLHLSWAPPAGQTPVAYRIFRATNSGGPYVAIADTVEPMYTDSDLENGVQYFYVIAALDALGNLSEFTVESNAIPTDSLAPLAPVLHAPTFSGRPFATQQPLVNVVGSAEPGASISLTHNGVELTQVFAQPQAAIESVNARFAGGRLSPSGRYYISTSFSDPPGLLLYDVETHTEQQIVTVGHFDDLNPRWTANSEAVLFVDFDNNEFNYYIRRYQLADGRIEDITDPKISSIQWAVMSPQLDRLAVMGYVDDGQMNVEGIWLLDLTTDEWTLLSQDYIYQFEPASLQWSPDGRYLSYLRTNPDRKLELLDTGTAAVHSVDEQPSGFFNTTQSWSPDGQSLAFVSSRAGNRQIWRYHVTTGLVEQITFGAVEHELPQWSADGRAIGYVKLNANNQLGLQDLQTGTESVLLKGSVNIYNTWQWLPTGYLLLELDSQLLRVAPAGRFEFKTLALDVGDNIFSAYAKDAAGNRSQAADNVLLIYRLGSRPDLAVSAQDLRLLPAAPRVGDQTRISITVHNQGDRDAPLSRLTLMAIDPAGRGETLLENGLVQGLPVAGRQTLSVDWRIGSQSGVYYLLAVLDPNNTIAELSEANNTVLFKVPVADNGGVSMQLSADARLYSANQPVNFSAQLVNAGSLFDGYIQFTIEDDQGNAVEALATQTVTELAYADSRMFALAWNTGSLFAGNYRLSARLFNAAGASIVSNAVNFSIGANSIIDSSVSSDRNRYSANEDVRVTGTIRYATGNRLLSGLQVRLRILDENHMVLSEHEQVLGDLLPGSVAAMILDWNTAITPAGLYRAELTVLESGVAAPLSTAQSAFEISADNVDMRGQLSLAADILDAGAAQHVHYSIHNRGNSALAQQAVTIALLDTDTRQILSSDTVVADIAAGGTFTGDNRFNTTGLPLKPYSVTLSVQGFAQVLDARSFVLLDRQPPQVDVLLPADSEFMNTHNENRIMAVDALSAIKRVEYRVDTDVWRVANVRSLPLGLYGAAMPALVEGVHTWQARAFDTADNMGMSAIVTFKVDNTPPLIVIEGITQGAINNQSFIPRVSVSDANLEEAITTLNSQPFVSGTEVNVEADYELLVYAVDQAGNSSEQVIHFAIDRTAPEILLSGVEQGAIVNSIITPIIEIQDPHLLTQTLTLNGLPFNSGDSITQEGLYALSVAAQDAAGNHANLTVEFEIDTTVPELVVSSPENHSTVATSVIDIIGRSEANAMISLESLQQGSLSLFADQNGDFKFSQHPLVEGENLFKLTAKDQAGNISTAVNLTVIRMQANEVELTGHLLAGRRVLVWLPQQAIALRALLEQLFAARQIDAAIVHKRAEVIRQLRSGRYNVVLLSDIKECNDGEDDEDRHDRDDDKRDRRDNNDEDDDDRDGCAADKHFTRSGYTQDELYNELRPMVAAGMGLVLIKTHPHNSHVMHDVFGVRTKGYLPHIRQLKLEDTPVSSAATLEMNGAAVRLQATQGTAIGKLLPGRHIAMIANSYIKGKTLVLGFNPAGIHDEAAAINVLDDTLAYAAPADVELSTGEILDMRWTAQGLSMTTRVKLEVSLSPGMVFIASQDGGVLVDAQHAEWLREVNSEETHFNAAFRLPEVKGHYMITARLFEDGRLLAEKVLPVVVQQDQASLKTSLLKSVQDLNVSSADKHKYYKALWLIKLAIKYQPATRREAEYAIKFLRYAYDLLDALSARQPDILEKVGHVLRVYQLAWSEFPLQ